jgi:hypothetical protein
MLYPAELRAEVDSRLDVQTRYVCRRSWFAGRGERIRTSGLLLPKQALYQAKLRPGEPKYSPIQCGLGSLSDMRKTCG